MPGDPVYPAGVTASDHIAHDMRMGRFPQQSTVEQFVAERADLDPRLLHRIRELSTPPRDDHDRAVLMLLDAYEATRRAADARVAAAYERGVRDAAKQAIHVGDHNREDMEARRIQGRILSLLTPKEAARDER